MTANSDYAQLAEMFTTLDEPSTAPASVDLLLLGHLPVQGGLWLIPYAGRESHGGMGALIRMHEDTVDLAIVGESTFDISQCESLDEAFDLIASAITCWMVQPPSDVDSTSLLHCDADRITLLSGADQAAVVGAYRLLKGLVLASSSAEETPPMNLVIVGTEERAANDAANRIVQTAHHQLGVQLSVSQPLPAMGSGSRVASQASFQRSSSIVDIISRIRAVSTEAPEVPEELQPSIPLTPRHAVEIEDTDSVPSMQDAAGTTMPDKSHPSLASHVEGLIGLQPRCPGHEEVELAVDTQGRVHVLADAEDFRDATIVASWVTQHQDLIAMACGGIEIDASATPKQHVFTANAIMVADLHGTDIALHLLTEVEVEGHRGLFSTPLN